MIAACVHTMFRVQKERDRMALVTPPAPEHSNDGTVPMPPKPNSTNVFDNQAPSRRLRAMSEFCPTCGALPRFSCIRANGRQRLAIHIDRYAVADGKRPA